MASVELDRRGLQARNVANARVVLNLFGAEERERSLLEPMASHLLQELPRHRKPRLVAEDTIDAAPGADRRLSNARLVVVDPLDDV